MHLPSIARHRTLTAVVTAAIVLGLAALPARADECSAAFIAVADRMQNSPAAMPSYSAGIRVRARMHSFPFLGTTFTGTATYARPGNYSLLLDNPPRGADKLQSFIHDMFADITTSGHWAVYDAKASCGPAGELLAHLTPKAQGDLKSLDLVLDAATAHVVKATFVREDGNITIEQRFAPVDGRDVIVHQDLSIATRQSHADVAADYHDITITTVVAGR